VYQTEKMLKDQAASFTGEQKDAVETDLKTLKEALAGTDLEPIRTATEKLAAGVQELGKQLYESAAAASAPAGGGEGASGASADDDVVDAEIVEDEGDQS
jgi:molecular chaperone DnaK